METKSEGLTVCTRCGVHKEDQARDFFGLWFVDFEQWTGWCPVCAGLTARMKSRKEDLTWIAIPLQAIWSNAK